QHGVFLHGRAVVDHLLGVARVGAELLDPADDLGADVDDVFRLQGAGGADGGLDEVALHLRRAERPGRVGVGLPVPEAEAAGHPGQDHQDREKLPHGYPLRVVWDRSVRWGRPTAPHPYPLFGSHRTRPWPPPALPPQAMWTPTPWSSSPSRCL